MKSVVVAILLVIGLCGNALAEKKIYHCTGNDTFSELQSLQSDVSFSVAYQTDKKILFTSNEDFKNIKNVNYEYIYHGIIEGYKNKKEILITTLPNNTNTPLTAVQIDGGSIITLKIDTWKNNHDFILYDSWDRKIIQGTCK